MPNSQHQTGAAAELYAASVFTAAGCTVYFPAMTQSKADFVIELDNTLLKVQVKKATKCVVGSASFIQVRLAGSCRVGYVDGDFDLLAVVYEGRIWLMPFSVAKDKKSLSFSIFGSGRAKTNYKGYEVSLDGIADAVRELISQRKVLQPTNQPQEKN